MCVCLHRWEWFSAQGESADWYCSEHPLIMTRSFSTAVYIDVAVQSDTSTGELGV